MISSLRDENYSPQWRGRVDDVRTFQPPDGAEEWLEEMRAHAKSTKRDEILGEMRGLMSDAELRAAA